MCKASRVHGNHGNADFLFPGWILVLHQRVWCLWPGAVVKGRKYCVCVCVYVPFWGHSTDINTNTNINPLFHCSSPLIQSIVPVHVRPGFQSGLKCWGVSEQSFNSNKNPPKRWRLNEVLRNKRLDYENYNKNRSFEVGTHFTKRLGDYERGFGYRPWDETLWHRTEGRRRL